MKIQTHRQRVLCCLNHQVSDRMVVELGSTRNTGIHSVAYRRLRAHLGLDATPGSLNVEMDEQVPELVESFGVGRRGSLAAVDLVIRERFDLDLRGIFLGEASGAPEVEFPDGTYRNAWGVVRRHAPESYYHEIVHSPLSGEITIDDLRAFPWPDPRDPGRFSILRRDALAEVGDIVDVVEVSDDIATQKGLMISPRHYRGFMKPQHRRFYEVVRGLTPAKIMYHCCSNVSPILDDPVEIGVDILNPIQTSADGMDTARLKREYGDRLVFMGGIDTQQVLRTGTPDEVRTEVKRRIDDLGPDGGYILAAVHNIQPDVPPVNICAMFDTALDYGRY